MNAPAQIITAIAAAGAAAFLPLSGLYEEAGILQEAVQKREAAGKAIAGSDEKSGAGRAGGGAAGEKTVEAAGSVRIPPGVSPAEASRTIAELANLDGSMMSSRQIIALLDKVMALPASHLEEARAVIQEAKNPVMGGMLYAALFSRWGELDPDAARMALETGAGTNKIFQFAGAASLAGGWMEKDPDSFLKWLNEDKEGLSPKDKELRENMMNGLMHMTNIDNATAEKLIAAAPKDRRPWMIMDMAERDSSIDPREAAARALAEAGDNEGQRSSINWRVGRMLAERDPMEAIKYAEQQDRKERGQTYEAAMSSWLREDKAGALKWLKGQPAEVQTDAVRGFRRQMDEMSYEEVAKLSGEVTGDASSRVWSMALEETADRDPKEALRYLPNISEAQRPNSYNEIAQEWTKKDPQAASEWVYNLSPGREKDHAIQGMVHELRSREPDSSTIWASTIGDESMRSNLVTENARTWLKRDRAAAEEWVHATDSISQEQKDKLLESK